MAGKIRRDPKRDPSWKEMQASCVIREGREEEFQAKLREVQSLYPDLSKQAGNTKAYELMGITKDVALKRWRRYSEEGADAETADEAYEAGHAREEAAAEFTLVLAGLPLKAERGEVLRWIESHPAMILARPANDDGLVELKPDDIRDAPCRSAVGQLQHWINKKDEFYREWMKRKPIPKAEEAVARQCEAMEELDPTLKDVIKMLDDLGC